MDAAGSAVDDAVDNYLVAVDVVVVAAAVACTAEVADDGGFVAGEVAAAVADSTVGARDVVDAVRALMIDLPTAAAFVLPPLAAVVVPLPQPQPDDDELPLPVAASPMPPVVAGTALGPRVAVAAPDAVLRQPFGVGVLPRLVYDVPPPRQQLDAGPLLRHDGGERPLRLDALLPLPVVSGPEHGASLLVYDILLDGLANVLHKLFFLRPWRVRAFLVEGQNMYHAF